MTSKSEEFSEIARRASAGDSSALLALCQEYETEVRIAARVHLGPLLRPHMDSVDITQSVHKSVIGKLLAGKIVIHDSAKLIALACLIARRKVAKRWRKHRRQVRPENEMGLENTSALQQLLSRSTINLVHREINREAILEIRENLSGGERKLIDLKLAGHTSEEIATLFDIDPVAVRVRWSRLCAKIRKQQIDADISG